MIAITASVCFAQTTGTVQGTIRDAKGQPLSNVNVILEGTGLTTTTDRTGNYVFTGVNPGSYTVVVQTAGFKEARLPVTITQQVTSRIDVALEPATETGTSRIIGTAPVRRTDPATSTVITSEQEQQVKSQPYQLYQVPGLLAGQPGITFSPSTGISHIRGSDYNQTGYQYDGISITNPSTNGFMTNLVSTGIKSANYYSGGIDPVFGGSTGGFVNLITQNGRDLQGGIFEYTNGPGYGWNYNGTNIQYGNVTPNGKLDYYTNIIAFRNEFPKAVFGLKDLDHSFDSVFKFNYYINPQSTLTVLHGQGNADYTIPGAEDTGGEQPTSKFEPGLGNGGNIMDTGDPERDFQYQHYRLSYLNYKRNFSPTSFLTYRLASVNSRVTAHFPSFNQYLDVETDQPIQQYLEYQNRVSPNYTFKLGGAYIPSDVERRVVLHTGVPIEQTARGRGYEERYADLKTRQFALYLNNQFKTTNDTLALNLGVRYAQQRYDVHPFYADPRDLSSRIDPDYTEDYWDPRVGLTYSPQRDLVIRTSYARTSQFADARRVQEFLTPFDVGRPALAANPGAAGPGYSTASNYGYITSRNRQFNRLRPSYADTYDLGFEKGFPAFGGYYTLGITGFRREQRRLIHYRRDSYVPLGGLRGYESAGTSSASGVEFFLQKRQRQESDWNGFLSYTNQVAKATTSVIDTAYLPFFYSAFATSAPLLGITDAEFRQGLFTEYPVTWNQRHTVYLLANKRISKQVETSINLDAGSGYPFLYGLGSSAFAGTIEGADAQHAFNVFGEAEFTEIPVVLPNRTTLAPIAVSPGKTGWAYRLSINTNFFLSDQTNLFFNVDNVFNKQIVRIFSTIDNNGNLFYDPPSAEYPQGRVYYGPKDIVTPVFLQFGIRTRF
jgi:hypothetical protein